MGYDVHRLCENRDLIIGGVKIDYEKGLLGHSDADVLLHAISDALLGAAALGDIGKHFPDTDEKYKGISSLILLKHVGDLLEEEGYLINNIDATIIAQAPKMRPYIDEMRKNIADTLGLHISQVNVKATTEEGLGFTGTGEGISSQAVCLISEASELTSYAVTPNCETCGGCGKSFGADAKTGTNTDGSDGSDDPVIIRTLC
jgi:2-C-methyl-D-erythritol 2,4-cyclodiphosphate synthase